MSDISEQEYDRQIARAERAKQLLNDSLLQEFIEGLRETTYDNIRTSPRQNVEEREELYKMLRVIDSFETQFKRAMDDGKVARSRLDAIKQSVQRFL